MSATFTLKGGKKIERALASLDSRVRNRTVGNALKRAAKPMVADAKSGVPKRTGKLRKSIAAQFKVNRRRGTGDAIIGPRRPEGSHGHLIELGTKPHMLTYTRIGSEIIPRGAWHPGTPPKPFMRPAFVAKRDEVEKAVRGELVEAIRKAKAKGY